MSFTWAQVRSTFFNLVGDSRQANTFFSDAQVEGFANKALRDMGQRAMYVDYEYTGTLPADSAGMKVPGVYNAWRGEASLSGVSRVLKTTTKSEILASGTGRVNISGQVSYWYTDMLREDSQAYIGFYPKPSADTTIRFYFRAIPDEVDDDADSTVVDVPEWATLAMVLHMLYQAFRVRAKKEDFNKAALFRGMYENIVDRLVMRVNGKIKRVRPRPLKDRKVPYNEPYYVKGTI